jgi:hypothetical protein
MNPNVKLAVKTLAAIDAAIEADQGNSFRYWQKQVLPHINDAYRQDNETDKFRTHLGASILGDECARKVWYSFRWATNKKFPGRMLRLFNRGHLEEARFIAMLLMIGCKVYQQNADGSQFKISRAGGHFGGSGDGVVIDIPDLQPGQPCLIESKTHGEKSFVLLKKDGVRESKFDHYVQMQLYMGEMGLAVALYMAVNKNTDELHLELVYFNKEIFEQFIHLGDRLPFLKEAPPRISNSSGWYKCVICDHRRVCHGLGTAPEINCRTCKFVEPKEDGTWACRKHGNFLSKEEQLAACNDYTVGI